MMRVALTLDGAEVLQEGRLEIGTVTFADGVIQESGTARRVDGTGFRVLPGIIDLHGDGFEKHLAPRRGAMLDMGAGMLSAEVDLATNGITTAVMAQFYSWEGGLRRPEFAEKFLSALEQTRDEQVIDLRAQLRFETHMLDDYDAVLALIERFGIRYVVFNDHLPHDRLEAGRTPPRLVGTALKSGRSPEAHLALMQDLHNRRHDVPEALKGLAAKLTAMGVRLGGHDEHSPEDRRFNKDMGITISEFPETRRAAVAAHDEGDGIILGAPNVMRQGSHKGNVSAQDLIAEGLCDALASDYHYPALRQAILKLEERGICNYAEGWRLVSSGPAKVLGLTDRGTLTPGLRADLIVEDMETRRIAAVFAGGKLASAQGEFAARLMS